jgi:DNA-nicking Smr family endonuclease
MTRRGKREPTADELKLWGTVTQSIAPLDKSNPLPEPPAADAKPEVAPKKSVAGVPPPKKPPPAKPAPALHPIDRRTKNRLGRGTVAIDARIDLHGLTQAVAHGRLRRFLSEAQEDGAKVVLVITGKGRAGAEGAEERGVLRRMVPAWLSAADLRHMVVGFDEASPGHGGSGALYVRIRRRR